MNEAALTDWAHFQAGTGREFALLFADDGCPCGCVALLLLDDETQRATPLVVFNPN